MCRRYSEDESSYAYARGDDVSKREVCFVVVLIDELAMPMNAQEAV
jgi:hypothetical protein